MDFLYLCIMIAGVAHGWDVNGVEYEKRQLVPLPRIGRSYYETKRQGLIPSPRVGRSSSSSSYHSFSRDCTLSPELCNELLDNKNLHEVHEGLPVMNLLAGRRKRSTSPDEEYNNDINGDDLELIKTLRSNPWDWDLGVEQDFFQRNSRQLIPAPRVGRSGNTFKNALISGQSSGNDEDMLIDPIDLQLRAAFIPRLGKRSSHKNYDDWSAFNDALKRAATFTPRIGRAAAFTPRIGRAAFTPRIGKKAAFIPRIGRSTEMVNNDLVANHSH